jgi:VanZ family protein
MVHYETRLCTDALERQIADMKWSSTSLLVVVAALLAAILICALAPSSYMTELPFIPQWLGEWADKNPNFRNFPVFAALSALLFFVVTFYQRLVTRYGRWRIALGVFAATGLLGIVLEVAQILIPGRVADWHDVLWASLGALAGTFVGALALMLALRSRSLASAD